MTIWPPSRAGSVTSAQAERRPISSIIGRVIGEPISSSGVTRKTMGRVAVPLRATSLNASSEKYAPPFMS